MFSLLTIALHASFINIPFCPTDKHFPIRAAHEILKYTYQFVCMWKYLAQYSLDIKHSAHFSDINDLLVSILAFKKYNSYIDRAPTKHGKNSRDGNINFIHKKKLSALEQSFLGLKRKWPDKFSILKR